MGISVALELWQKLVHLLLPELLGVKGPGDGNDRLRDQRVQVYDEATG